MRTATRRNKRAKDNADEVIGLIAVQTRMASPDVVALQDLADLHERSLAAELRVALKAHLARNQTNGAA